MSQWGPIRNLSATRYCLLTLTLLQCFWAHWSVKQRGGFVQCLSGSKGLWSIGIFKGSGPFDLQPVEEYSPRQDTLTAWPVANPVLTCASLFLDDEVAGVASPVLWRNSTGAITMFYTLQYRGWGRDAVGAATSVDGGRSFQYAQPVLQEPWALGTPSLFQHAGQVYMLVPSLGKEVTWLYRATSFPHSWEREAEALPFPVSAVHVFQHVDRWFTVLVMTYAARRPMLAGFVAHYAACPSVQEVVVVWNKGPLPEPGVDYDDRAVPVRVRAEAANSLNNRFRVDPALRTRAVLSIDDDIRLTCADVEAGFAVWRRAPETMHGFFPRRMAGEPLTFHGERDTIEAGAYNVILTGAAFLDSATAFPAYWADAVAPARATVDRLFNGEDVLMNFVLANRTAALQRGASNAAPVRYISFLRPKVRWEQRRVDISKLSPVGISHNFAKFLDATQTYLRTFQEVFGTNPLVLQEFDWTATPRPFCGSKTLGCVYL
ncbi:hypothetical protein APUTEX25_003112 [Auxenochlorella protothecoides]|uniref:Glycosyl transferase 64 domain-containing protein n=1 Tax=Auxenochlorella protothecoides TaxID=3075 RepID=A0A3M7KXY4_AUXPR|nr:hypothetical protein APUTEX25_003112 [Auxenochlorella protothecoides]|eukprot:RMZ54734.1 hypothetical protein APUTEX25_003112 [Auxenochlorella protothecoides]